MGLFDFFKKNGIEAPIKIDTEIPKDVFIEEGNPVDQFSPSQSSNGASKDIIYIYAYLQADYEGMGYGDALVNADESSRKENTQLLKMKLHILMQEVVTNYEDKINELDFHIASRGRSGLVDLVEELKSKRKRITEHLDIIGGVKADSINETGLYQQVILSYQKGFMRGLTALTQSQVLNKQSNN